MLSLVKKSLFISTVFFTLQVFAQLAVSDNEIVKSIQSQIANNAETSSTQITLSSQTGTVSLAGTVDTDQQASALVEIAQFTPGVVDVDTDHLSVKKSEQPFTDTVITAKIKGLFLRDKLFTEADIAALSVKVETKNGVVHLSGTASSDTQVQNAIHVARSVKGVQKVVSNIKIKS